MIEPAMIEPETARFDSVAFVAEAGLVALEPAVWDYPAAMDFELAGLARAIVREQATGTGSPAHSAKLTFLLCSSITSSPLAQFPMFHA
jgi:hypothetical protein